MKTPDTESPAKRLPVVLLVVTALAVIGGGLHFFFSNNSSPADGPKIIAAAQAYTRALRQSHAPVPHAVPLQTLIDKGLLKPADVGSFQGLDAKVFLTGANTGGPDVLMTVRLSDGTDLVLLANGATQTIKR